MSKCNGTFNLYYQTLKARKLNEDNNFIAYHYIHYMRSIKNYLISHINSQIILHVIKR